MTSTLMTNTREGLGNVRKYITAKPTLAVAFETVTYMRAYKIP